MTSETAWNTTTVHDALISGRPAAKQQAIEAIDSATGFIDREQLNALLLTSIRRDFKAPRPGVVEDQRYSDTRCWLLSALARVAGDHAEAASEVRRHLDARVEPYDWARFWTLEGLVNANPSDLRALAEALAASTGESPVVKALARLVLAALGDESALDETRKALQATQHGDPKEQWAILRALRVVPGLVPSVVQELCLIVEKGIYADITFDAIAALGRLSPKSQYAEKAAQALATFVVNHRWPSYEAMRTKALIGLGNLGVERWAPVLIEELLDDNPAIVYAASRALEKVLGVKMATARLLEEAQRVGPGAVQKFATALRSMVKRTEVVEALEAVMLTSRDVQYEFARDLLSEVGGRYAFQKLRARTDAASKYAGALEQAEERIRALFETSIVEAQHGFRVATRMDVTVFGLGIALIGVSAGLLLLKDQTLDTWAGVGITGGAGVLSVLYTLLVARPREQVRQGVDHLMQLKVVFLGYLRQLHQTDQAFTRRLLEDERLPAEEIKRFTDTVGSTMSAALAQLATAAGGRRRDGSENSAGDSQAASSANVAPPSILSPISAHTTQTPVN